MIKTEEELERQAPIIQSVKSLMKLKKISQKKIAAAFGYTEAWLSQIMHNKRSLSIGELSKIAGLLGVELADLCPKSGEAVAPKTIDEIVERKVLEILNKHKK